MNDDLVSQLERVNQQLTELNTYFTNLSNRLSDTLNRASKYPTIKVVDQKDDYAWLIERRFDVQSSTIFDGQSSTIIEYCCVKAGKIVWEQDWKNALRFHRKEDAESMIDGFSLKGAYPSEHAWG